MELDDDQEPMQRFGERHRVRPTASGHDQGPGAVPGVDRVTVDLAGGQVRLQCAHAPLPRPDLERVE